METLPSDRSVPVNASADSGGGGAESPPARKGWRPRLKKAGLILLGLVLLAGGGMIGAEYYTARPQFCATCHVMGTYYDSWSLDSHSGEPNTWCVDCHYAPGEQHTLKAKFKGLSQMASYFTGRYGTARPRAHVSDASCLTAPCHGDRKYLKESLRIGEPRLEKRYVGGQETEVQRNPTVRFVHEKHLNVEEKLAENRAALEVVRRRLQAAAGEDWPKVQAAARSVLPALVRGPNLRKVVRELGLEAHVDDALELMRLEHLRARFEQLGGLTCAACHGYDPSGRSHVLAGDRQTCYTCHFQNHEFNRDTGECLKCHEPPVRQIVVHQQVVELPFHQAEGAAVESTVEPVLMDHRDIVERNIDCASCHLDVIQGEAVVTARDCTHCHDQEVYLKDFESRTTETVAEYHRLHVAAQRAKCMDCHRAIEHRLIEPERVAEGVTYLEPILNDCQHCHPSHHHQQMDLLMGVGGRGVPGSMPNAMFGSRINCRACHTKAATDLKGDGLIKATEATCVACHGDDYARLFQQWRNEIETSVKEAEAALTRVEGMMHEWRSRGAEVPEGVSDALEQARANVHFVRSGNGIHNKAYALKLLDWSIRSLDEAVMRLMPE